MSREKTNCPNCGAPIGTHGVECPYCGTKYFDFSDLPIGEIFHIRVRDRDGVYITAPVRITEFTVTRCPEYQDCRMYADGAAILTMQTMVRENLEIDISMEGIQ